MADIPLSVKLSCNSLFRTYSNTLMHTDKYNSQLFCLLHVSIKSTSNKGMRQGKRDEKEGEREVREKSKINPSGKKIFLVLIFCKMLNNYPLLLIRCNRMQRFDLELCLPFTYLCVMRRRMVFKPCVFMVHNLQTKIHTHKH